jgi:hypothetical protein
MFGHFFLAVTLAAATPAPTPTPALKTIATVRASSRCAEIVTHANNAISSTLIDNEVIAQSITQLRFVNLDDGSIIHRTQGLNALRDLASTLYKQSHGGDGEIKRLRALAALSPDVETRTELKAFADALGGALGRQLKLARDLNGLLAYADYDDMRGFGNGYGDTSQFFFGANDPLARTIPGAPQTVTQYARTAANDFQDRLPAIMNDENQAAGHVVGALGRC